MEKFKRQRKWIKQTLPTACGYIENIKQIFLLTQSLIYLITYERGIQSPAEHLRWSVLQR